MAVLSWVLYGFAALGVLGALGAAVTVLVGLRHGRSPVGTPPPGGLSMVVPIRGADESTEDNLTALVRSELDGPVEYLFACETTDDPAYEVCERVRAANPDRDVAVVLSGPAGDRMGKQHNIAAAAARARYAVLGSMDADVRVEPDTLATGLRHLARERTGVAYFLPRYDPPGPAGGTLVALYSNYYYQLYMAATALSRNAPFITGGLWLMSPAARAAVGELTRFGNTLSDDSAIGRAVVAAGLRNELVPRAVSIRYERLDLAGGFRHVWKWLALLRAEGLATYLAIAVLWHPVWWATLGLIVAAIAGGPVGIGVSVWIAAVAARYAGAAALHATAYQGLARRYAGWLLPYEIGVVPVLFGRGLFARTVTWRGRRYEIGPRGVIRSVREG